MTTQRGAPLDLDLRDRLAVAIKDQGEQKVAAAIGCSRQSLARALGGLPVYRGTVALVERWLEGLKPRRRT